LEKKSIIKKNKKKEIKRIVIIKGRLQGNYKFFIELVKLKREIILTK
jgi:hypothetical protein